ncbi:hypothetical protein GOV13_00050 [Candidatus Pacearchaeota archaeon]|nr:hypothetical protein [Candidatus Pacearchaeota archaeon]
MMKKMTNQYTKLEHIIKGLTKDLYDIGFSKIGQRKDEIVRYKKVDSPSEFQVGIRQEDDEFSDMIEIYLTFEFQKPEGVFPDIRYLMLPMDRGISLLLRNSQVYNTHEAGTESIEGRISEGRMIGFEKSTITRSEMKAVLREMIDYACNLVEINYKMLIRTESISE